MGSYLYIVFQKIVHQTTTDSSKNIGESSTHGDENASLSGHNENQYKDSLKS